MRHRSVISSAARLLKARVEAADGVVDDNVGVVAAADVDDGTFGGKRERATECTGVNDDGDASLISRRQGQACIHVLRVLEFHIRLQELQQAGVVDVDLL
jgi:hypothetical protein